jgi:hypothetical protein
VASNWVIAAIPDTPAVIAFQVFSVPMPTGLINPTPVTTTRRSKPMYEIPLSRALA